MRSGGTPWIDLGISLFQETPQRFWATDLHQDWNTSFKDDSTQVFEKNGAMSNRWIDDGELGRPPDTSHLRLHQVAPGASGREKIIAVRCVATRRESAEG